MFLNLRYVRNFSYRFLKELQHEFLIFNIFASQVERRGVVRNPWLAKMNIYRPCQSLSRGIQTVRGCKLVQTCSSRTAKQALHFDEVLLLVVRIPWWPLWHNSFLYLFFGGTETLKALVFKYYNVMEILLWTYDGMAVFCYK